MATQRQKKLVTETIQNATGLPVLGAIPRVKHHDLPERHLGLVPHQEHPAALSALDLVADLAEEHLDLEQLWNIAQDTEGFKTVPPDPWGAPVAYRSEKVKIGVIRDSAFQFYYPENLEAFERLGAEVVTFSSLNADRLPDVDALYLGGGFPETHAEILAGNEGLRRDIKRAADEGLPIYAECGGLMYLGEALVLDGNTYPMAGVFPVTLGLEKKPQGHGYTNLRSEGPNSFYKHGELLVGHEFHYSRPLEYDAERIRLAMAVERGHGFDQGRDGLVAGNVLAMYTHLHALTTTRWAESLVDLAVRRKNAESSETKS